MDIEIVRPAKQFDEEEDEYTSKINRYVLSGDLLAGRITTTKKTDGTEETSKSYYHLKIQEMIVIMRIQKNNIRINNV